MEMAIVIRDWRKLLEKIEWSYGLESVVLRCTNNLLVNSQASYFFVEVVN